MVPPMGPNPNKHGRHASLKRQHLESGLTAPPQRIILVVDRSPNAGDHSSPDAAAIRSVVIIAHQKALLGQGSADVAQ